MAKKKIHVIAVAVLTCIVCISMIAGATFALFTDNDRVDISVTTATVDVEANILEESIVNSSNGTELNTQLGKDLQGKKLIITNMLPGDVVSFQVQIESLSSVDVRYCLTFGCKEENKALFDKLLLGVRDHYVPAEGTEEPAYTYYVNGTSKWELIEYKAPEDGRMLVTKDVQIELPAYVANFAQAQSCELEFAVEVVQANAQGNPYDQEASAKLVHRVSNQQQLTDAVAAVKSGEVIVIDSEGIALEIVDLSGVEKSFEVRGGKLESLTINAPDAEIDYRVDETTTVDVIAIKGQSLHIFGAVEALTVKSGRAVVEKGAQVQSAVAAPVEEKAVAKIIAKEVIGSATVSPAANTTAAIETIANIGTLTVAGEGKAEVSVPENVVVDNLEITNTGDESTVKIDGKAENIVVGENTSVSLSQKVSTEADLAKAMAVGGEVVLANSIDVAQLINIDKDVILDLNGMTITNLLEDAIPFNITNEGTSFALKNGNLVIPESNIKSYGFIKVNAPNCKIDLNEVTMDGNTNVGALIRSIGFAGNEITLIDTNATTNYLIVYMIKAYTGKLTVTGGEYNLISQDSTVNTSQKSNNYAGFKVDADEFEYVDNLHAIFTDVVINSTARHGVAVNVATVVYNNCTIGNPKENDYADHMATAVSVSNIAKVTVNGGTYTGKYALYVFSSGGSIVVNNATLKGDIRMDVDPGYHTSFGAVASIELSKDVVWTEGRVINESAGKEYCSFIWHVDTVSKLERALEVSTPNYTIVMDEDITVTGNISLTDVKLAINLNKHTLNLNTYSIEVGKGADLTVNDGKIAQQKNSAFFARAESRLTVDGVDIAVTNPLKGKGVSAIVITNATSVDSTLKTIVNVNNSKLDGSRGFGISTNATPGTYNDIELNVTKSEISAQTALFLVVPGAFNFTECTLTGHDLVGVLVRGGNATFTDSTISTNIAVDLETAKMSNGQTFVQNGIDTVYKFVSQFSTGYYYKNWGSGNNVPWAALVVGNRSDSDYRYPVSCTLVNTTVSCVATVEGSTDHADVDLFADIYVFATEQVVTLNADENSKGEHARHSGKVGIDGGIVFGGAINGGSIVYNGEAVNEFAADDWILTESVSA